MARHHWGYRGIATALLWLPLVACEGGGSGFRGGSDVSPTSPSSTVESVRVTAEPAVARPQFLPRPHGCDARPPFRIRVEVGVHTRREIRVRALGFEFVDEVGGRTVPVPTPGSSVAASIPVSVPLPLPTSGPLPTPQAGPIPIPGSSTRLPGAIVSGERAARFPFMLRFACGTGASGTLFVAVQTSGEGTTEVRRTSVLVGRE